MHHELDKPSLSLRQLKAALYVARHKNLTHAAEALNRSQTAITKSILSLEEELNVKLFDRSNVGMIPTVYGSALAKRVARVEDEFNQAGQAYLSCSPETKRFENIALFSMDISHKRLLSLIALHDVRSISAAAAHLEITEAAIYASVRQLEKFLKLQLFVREPNGLLPTSYCSLLVRHIKLVFSELRHAIEDLASINGMTSGKIIIGTLPYSRTILTPRSINILQQEHPQLKVSTRDGPYLALESLLRSGDIDMIIGATRQHLNDKAIYTETLFNDSVSLIVRSGHPLLNVQKIQLEDLFDYGWVLPACNTPTREMFNNVLGEHHSHTPPNTISTSSLSTARGLLLESDRIALLSEHQVYYEYKYRLLKKLPVKLDNSTRPMGVTMRANTEPSPAASMFLACLRQTVDELYPVA